VSPAPALLRGAAVVALVAAGCGYSLGYRAPSEARSIAVPIFRNATFPIRREVEFELSNRVRQELGRLSSLRLADSEDADLILRGTIVEFRESLVVEGRGDEKIESNLVAVVDCVLENRLAGGARREFRVTTSEPFSTALGETLADRRGRALQDLAQRVVLGAEDWGEEPGEAQE
jgi:hypothetical protein